MVITAPASAPTATGRGLPKPTDAAVTIRVNAADNPKRAVRSPVNGLSNDRPSHNRSRWLQKNEYATAPVRQSATALVYAALKRRRRCSGVDADASAAIVGSVVLAPSTLSISVSFR